MTFVLDTNVVSELRKSDRVANASVRAWARARRPSELYLSAVTVTELEVGIGRVERRDGTQGKRLRMWLEDDLLDVFAGRILPFDLATARRAAQLHVPDPRPERDAMIAATAAEHGMTVVTRNVKDFATMGVPLIDPWTD
ncbi:type II toxin-antitoxin system VapC family toxin [Nocardia shimofusensis]|uniref:type II toxin-antitoxin system VapC family toxin n=1 Tax=Nocardia shimofusensis TaxID=228596 RepID=UPI00082F67A0|nr:type II toxin-antitoxin system VapC family toxin [Nocardia shimofusensis]